MPRNDDGEFELVLGNRQLLSVFFIVVILLGVFFTMGYIVGRNSAPVLAELPKKAEKPLTVDSATAPSAGSDAPAPKEVPAPKETAPQLPTETRTETAQANPEKEDTAPAPKPVKTTKENTPKTDKGEHKVESKVEAKKENARAASNSDEPAAGRSYLQLAATSKREADVMVDVLRQKGFKALAAEIQDKPGTYRVLVGPVPEGGRNSLRADLQKSGFPGNSAIPRTY